VRPTTNSAGPVYTKPSESKSMVAPGVSETPRLSIRIVGEIWRDIRCAPIWHANCRGSLLPAVNLYRIVCPTRMVSARDTRV
jgi:hypothetical protein